MSSRAALVRRAVLAGLAAVVLAFFATLWTEAGSDRPLSVVDEHVHLDTHFKVHRGTYPHRGALMGREVVQEWACGVGHEGGATTVPCGDPALGPDALPSGRYTSGYIHYPTYFLAAEGYRSAAEAVGQGRSALDVYRHFSALVMMLGVLACAAVGHRHGLRGAALVAATLVPVAASSIAIYGTMANPSSAMILCGALIAGAGTRWVLTGRGFWWLAAAGAFAAVVSVTASFPVGTFILAGLAGMVARGRGVRFAGGWRPTWWQVAVLVAIVVAPVVVYGMVIASRATQPDEVLYSFYAVADKTSIVAGAFAELSLHTPWFEAGAFDQGQGILKRSARGLAAAEPSLVNVLLFGVLALAVLTTALARPRSARRAMTDGEATDRGATDSGATDSGADPVRLLAGATLAGILLYPPALRIANAVNSGIDHGIVSRYSMAFTPLVVLVVLLLVPHHRGYVKALALLGTVGVLALSVGAWL